MLNLRITVNGKLAVVLEVETVFRSMREGKVIYWCMANLILKL